MTTTLAPPHAVLPADPDVVWVSNRRAAAPRVTAVLLVRADALGPSSTGGQDGGVPAVSANRPSAIIANTIKGKGVSFAENTHVWHTNTVTEEIYVKALAELEP